MRRIGIDLSGLWRRKTGIFRYAASITAALLARDGDSVSYTLFYRRGEPVPSIPGAQRARFVETPWRNERLAMQVWFPLAQRWLDLDGIHYTAFPPPLAQQRGLIASIHDVTAVRYPETMTWVGRRYWRPLLHHAARAGEPILVPSLTTRADVIALLGAAPERVVLTPYAVDPLFGVVPPPRLVRKVRRRWELPDRFLLAVGTLEPRKNLQTLFAALERLRTSLTPPPLLVVAGRAGWGNREIERQRAVLGEAIRFTGHITDAELITLYHCASVFVYPSLYEGFGFPVLEAFWAGCPVVTTTSSAIPEVAGNAALLVDPLDAVGLADAIRKVWLDRRLAANLRHAGIERARAFSWERCAELTSQAYAMVRR